MAGDPTSKRMYPAHERNGEGIPVAVLGEISIILFSWDLIGVCVAQTPDAVVIGLDNFDRRRDGLRKANVDRQGRSGVRRRPRHADRLPVPQVHQDADARRPRVVLRKVYAKEVLRRKLSRNTMESVS